MTLEPQIEFSGMQTRSKTKVSSLLWEGDNAYRRARRLYLCQSCGMPFAGSGSWKTAKQHAANFGHTVIQNGNVKFRGDDKN